MQNILRYIKERKEMPFWVSQCLYGVSVIATFTIIGQIVSRVL